MISDEFRFLARCLISTYHLVIKHPLSFILAAAAVLADIFDEYGVVNIILSLLTFSIILRLSILWAIDKPLTRSDYLPQFIPVMRLIGYVFFVAAIVIVVYLLCWVPFGIIFSAVASALGHPAAIFDEYEGFANVFGAMLVVLPAAYILKDYLLVPPLIIGHDLLFSEAFRISEKSTEDNRIRTTLLTVFVWGPPIIGLYFGVAGPQMDWMRNDFVWITIETTRLIGPLFSAALLGVVHKEFLSTLEKNKKCPEDIQ